MTVEEARTALCEVLDGAPEIRTAILFGSVARGMTGPRSDIDVAVARERALRPEEKVDLALRLEHRLGRPVDLLDLHELRGEILHQVLTTGSIIRNADTALLAGFIKRMLFHQADMMPLSRRMLLTKARRFAYGHASDTQEARGSPEVRRQDRVQTSR